MSTVLWEDILPLVTPDIPTCPQATIKEYLPIVASDFFARTHIWRASLEGYSTVPGQAEYDIASPLFDAVIESVLWLKVNGHSLTHVDSRLVHPEFMNAKGVPTRFWVVNDTALRLFYIPDTEWPIDGEVALKPKRNARGIPRWVYETWVDTLVSGVLYRLCRVRDKDWTDMDFATMHKNIYEQGVTNARIRDLRNVRLHARMRPL